MATRSACICVVMVIGIGCRMAIARNLYPPAPWTQPIGNQLSYNIRVTPPSSFDVSRYSRQFQRNFIPDLAGNQLNGLPLEQGAFPLTPDGDTGDMYLGGAMERSAGISSSIDIVSPPQQSSDRLSNSESQRRYVGMVSEITNNDIGPRQGVDGQDRGERPQQQQLQPGLPPFLAGTSADVQNKFLGIVSNREKSFQQKQDELDAMMAELDENRQQMYREFRSVKDGEEKVKRAKIHSIVATLSPKAQAAFAKVSAILTNTQMNDGERWQMIQNAYSRMDDDVKKELDRRFEGISIN